MPKDNECLMQILSEFAKVFTRSFGVAEAEQNKCVNKSDETLRKAIRRNPWVFMKIANKQLYIHGKYQFEKNINAITKFLDDCYDGKHPKEYFLFQPNKIKEKWESFPPLTNLFPEKMNRARDIGGLVVSYLDHKSLLSICFLDGVKNQNIKELEEELKKESKDNDPEVLNFRRAAYKELFRRKIPRLLSCGLGHSIVIMEDGTVMNFGYSFYGQLGRWTFFQANPWPKAVSFGSKKVIHAACGDCYSVVILEDGTTISFGSNMQGRLGRKLQYPTAGSTPGTVDLPENKKAMQVACGLVHSIVLMEDGTVFGFGNNYYGQLGIRPNDRRPLSSRAVRLPGNKKAIQVACGAHYSLILMEDGIIFSVGFNDNGQLGRLTSGDNNQGLVAVNFLQGSKKAIQVACGYNHSLVLMEDGTVLSFGSNEYGQLGRITTNNANNPYPKAIDFRNKKAIQVACGYNHSLVLMEDGTVFSFGDNEKGQLGRITNGNINPLPGAVNLGNRKAVQAACGGEHSLVLMVDGTAFSFGNNHHGELGRKTNVDINPQPEAVSLPPMKSFKLENAIIRWRPEWRRELSGSCTIL